MIIKSTKTAMIIHLVRVSVCLISTLSAQEASLVIPVSANSICQRHFHATGFNSSRTKLISMLLAQTCVDFMPYISL